MEMKVLEDKKNRLVLKIKDADHTLLNALRKELWNDKGMKAAGYSIKHPQISVPQLIVETTGEDARKTVLEAVKRLKKENDKIRKEAKKIR